MLEIIVKYNEFDVDQGHVKDVSFTDNLTGSLDELNVTFGDPENKWISGWIPKKNDLLTVTCSLGDVRLQVFDFLVDSWDLQAWPGEAQLKSLSGKIVQGELRKKRTVTHYEVTLRGVVSGLAQRNKLKLFWEGEDTPRVKVLRQKNMSDLAFLRQLAQQTGRACKVQNGYLIFTTLAVGGTRLERFGGEARLVPGEGVRRIVLRPSDLTSAPRIQNDGATPSRREFRRYTPIEAALTRTAGVEPETTFDGGAESAVNVGFGTDLAAWSSALEAHLSAVRITFGVVPRNDIVSGSVVYLDLFGTYSGTYHAEKVVHRIGSSGWQQDLDLRRISAATITPTVKAVQVVEDQTARFAAEVRAARTANLDAEMNIATVQGFPPPPPTGNFNEAFEEMKRRLKK